MNVTCPYCGVFIGTPEEVAEHVAVMRVLGNFASRQLHEHDAKLMRQIRPEVSTSIRKATKFAQGYSPELRRSMR